MNETIIQLVGTLHPPLTHFPIVCSILALLVLGISSVNSKTWLQEAAAWLWSLTFLSALASGLSGHLFALHLGLEKQFSPLPSQNILNGLLREHVLWAMGSLFFSSIAFIAALKSLRERPWPKTVQITLGLVVAVCFGLAGHEGGEMVYGSERSAETAGFSSPALDPLELAKNYREKLVKMNSQMWNSRTHGHRWVNTYVSKEAVEAYKNTDILPVGSLVVKESFEDRGGNPSETEGPLYVMWKGKTSDSPSTRGWQYALAWEKPVSKNPEGLQGPIRWLPGDSHLNSCIKCHNHFKAADYMGGVP